jgi:signal transduction histidine kinase/CheY-like chemotaxis protein
MRPRAASIRGLLLALLIVVVLLAALLSVVTVLQVRAATDRTVAERDRVTSFRLADSMRQSSNDLTRMVRLYVTTGDPRYRRYYFQILDIRRGTARRPLDYDSSYWDRVLGGETRARLGPRASLTALMRRAHFAGDEFRALDASLNASNHLAQLEIRTMGQVAPRIARGIDRTYLSDVAALYRRLVDTRYDAEKRTIMKAIDRFIALVDARTARRESQLQARTDRLLAAQVAVILALIAALLTALAVAARAIVRPLSRLASLTRRISHGDWSQRAHPHGVRELGQLAADFNEMADAVENELVERRRAEHAAEAADRAKSAFLAMMSHELRTPLVAVTGTLEILSLDGLDARQRELVDLAMASARSLLAVIGDVLDFSRIEAGVLDIVPVTVSVRRLVGELGTQYRHTAAARGLKLDVDTAPGLSRAHIVDGVRLRQVLGNLLSNALKFTPQGRVDLRVEVRACTADSQTLRFTITDTGIGISPEDQKRLFKPFTQASTDNARKSEGSGLGLAICRQLVEAMGGSVSLDSELGRGTEVSFELALLRGAEADAEPVGGAVGAAVGLRRRLPSRAQAVRERSMLLLVEDNPVNRQVLTGQLEAIGFRVDAVEDAETALQRFASCEHALVFTDIQLPRIDGYGLTERLRAAERAAGRRRVPVLALTASALQGERERCRQAGMDDLVTKPTTMPILAGTLRRWMPHVEWPEVADEQVGLPALPAALDASALDEIAAGDHELAAQVVAHYARAVQHDLAALTAALEDDDRERLRDCAHQIGGASRTVGAVAVAGWADRIERSALDADCGELAGLAHDLRSELVAAMPELTR